MYRTLVIVLHTFLESIVQPIYSLLLLLGAGIITIFALLPFFTFGEDTLMFKSVGLDVILLLVLIATLFATSKSIYDEIEDRTMLTLMSKPVARWEVLVGKYLGIILAAAIGVAALGAVLCLATYLRIPDDYSLKLNTLDEHELYKISSYRWMNITGLSFSLVQVWLEISALAAVSVALSTRFSLVVNLPVVILIYMAGNLTRFLFPLEGADAALAGRSVVIKAFAWLVSLLLPFLETFDIRAVTVYKPLRMMQFSNEHDAVAVGKIVKYLCVSAAYAAAYSTFALAAGMISFRNRELGGGEG